MPSGAESILTTILGACCWLPLTRKPLIAVVIILLEMVKKTKFKHLINKLSDIGFYDHTGGLIDDVKKLSIKQKDIFPEFDCNPDGINRLPYYGIVSPIPDATGRAFDSDGENIAEKGPVLFTMEIASILSMYGYLRIESLSQNISDDLGYTLSINGRIFQFLTKNEMTSQVSQWDVCSDRAIATVNQFITNHTDEIFYRQWAGNDTRLVLLSRQQFEIISRSDLIKETDKPIDVGQPVEITKSLYRDRE